MVSARHALIAKTKPDGVTADHRATMAGVDSR